MSTELDELEETSFTPDHSGTEKANRIRAGKKSMERFAAGWRAKPKWIRQLRTIKGHTANKKLTAKVFK